MVTASSSSFLGEPRVNGSIFKGRDSTLTESSTPHSTSLIRILLAEELQLYYVMPCWTLIATYLLIKDGMLVRFRVGALQGSGDVCKFFSALELRS